MIIRKLRLNAQNWNIFCDDHHKPRLVCNECSRYVTTAAYAPLTEGETAEAVNGPAEALF